jgi:hypothetical protein
MIVRRYSMTTLWSSLRSYTLALLVAISLLLVAAPTASANVRVEGEGGNLPFYARLGRGEIYHTDDWAAIVFYRPPTCIPIDFNLLDFFDIPGAFGCTPPTTDGFSIWEHGPGIDSAPKLVELHGLGAVPVWFVRWPALQAVLGDDVVTIAELASLQPLIGSASSYHETLRPSEGVKVSTIEFNARGRLADGRAFQLEATAISPTPTTTRYSHTRIVFR